MFMFKWQSPQEAEVIMVSHMLGDFTVGQQNARLLFISRFYLTVNVGFFQAWSQSFPNLNKGLLL